MLVLAAAPVGPARAATPAVDALQAVVRAEEKVLAAAEAERLDLIGRERAAAAELARAAEALESLLKAPPDSPERARLADAERAHLVAERALVELVAAAPRHADRVAASQVRLAELRSSASTLVAASPQPGLLEGSWEIRYVPTGASGWMRLAQQGAFVTGEDALLDGRRGSLSGTQAGSKLELTRIDSVIGRDVVLAGMLNTAGELEGTWQSTQFGRGTAEAGTWRAKRVVVPPAETPAPAP
jgi:hypothetical protein